MTEKFWEKIKHFTPDENWGDVDKVNPYLIIALDALRDAVGKPIVIHNAYATKGHSETSMHYVGEAADIHIVGISLVDAYLAVEKLGLFNGIGVYRSWNNPGIHVDLRQKPARWGQNEAGVYVALNDKYIAGCLNV